MLPARDEVYLRAARMKAGADLRADGAGTKNSDSQRVLSSCVRSRMQYTVWQDRLSEKWKSSMGWLFRLSGSGWRPRALCRRLRRAARLVRPAKRDRPSGLDWRD